MIKKIALSPFFLFDRSLRFWALCTDVSRAPHHPGHSQWLPEMVWMSRDGPWSRS